MPELIEFPPEELKFSFARSSGPGGQNVNKVNSKAILHWNFLESELLPDDVRQRFLAKYRHRLTNEGEIVIMSQRFRDQAKNIADCVEKLQEMVAGISVAPVRRRKTKPSRASGERRLKEKRSVAQRKQQRRVPPDQES